MTVRTYFLYMWYSVNVSFFIISCYFFGFSHDLDTQEFEEFLQKVRQTTYPGAPAGKTLEFIATGVCVYVNQFVCNISWSDVRSKNYWTFMHPIIHITPQGRAKLYLGPLWLHYLQTTRLKTGGQCSQALKIPRNGAFNASNWLF